MDALSKLGVSGCRRPIGWLLACCACAQGAVGDLQLDTGEKEASTDAETGAHSVDSATDTSTAFDSGADERSEAADAASTEAASADDGRSTTDAPGADASSADASGSDATAPADALPDGLPCACGRRSVCIAGACTAARRVFVSDETYDGALGGHAGADATCQKLATGAGLDGTWMAWISDSTSSPSQRFSRATVGYFLLDGTSVATSWTDLTTNGPAHAIDLTETGVSLASSTASASKTWTATLVSGALSTPSCSNFSSNASTQTGGVGHCTGFGTVNWTSAYAGEACNVTNHLYCFEQ